jgi:hypothetical protein
MRDRVRKYADGGAVADLDPSEALKEQIAALRKSGREALERQQAAQQPKPEPQNDLSAALDSTSLPASAKTWLLAHPEYVLNEDKNRQIAALHDDLVDEGIEPYGRNYFQEVERRLELHGTLLRNLNPNPAQDVDPEAVEKALSEARHGGEVYDPPSGNSRVVLDAPRRKPRDEPIESPRRIYSAPPSRSVPTSNGTRYSDNNITLGPAQKEAARIAGISEKEYAAQLLVLNRRKANGDYQ